MAKNSTPQYVYSGPTLTDLLAAQPLSADQVSRIQASAALICGSAIARRISAASPREREAISRESLDDNMRRFDRWAAEEPLNTEWDSYRKARHLAMGIGAS